VLQGGSEQGCECTGGLGEAQGDGVLIVAGAQVGVGEDVSDRGGDWEHPARHHSADLEERLLVHARVTESLDSFGRFEVSFVVGPLARIRKRHAQSAPEPVEELAPQAGALADFVRAVARFSTAQDPLDRHEREAMLLGRELELAEPEAVCCERFEQVEPGLPGTPIETLEEAFRFEVDRHDAVGSVQRDPAYVVGVRTRA